MGPGRLCSRLMVAVNQRHYAMICLGNLHLPLLGWLIRPGLLALAGAFFARYFFAHGGAAFAGPPAGAVAGAAARNVVGLPSIALKPRTSLRAL